MKVSEIKENGIIRSDIIKNDDPTQLIMDIVHSGFAGYLAIKDVPYKLIVDVRKYPEAISFYDDYSKI